MAKKNYIYGGKATAVLEWLNTEPNATNHHIAKHVGCSASYVHKLRKEMVHVQEEPKPGEYIEAEGELTPNEIDAILDERGSRYGDFLSHARITQTLKDFTYLVLRNRQKTLAPDQQEALDMIFHKIGRIINGDPDYADSWVDIAGYAKLVSDRLQGTVR